MVIQAFRDNIPKWITGIILVLIIGPFALWGINSYFSASTDTSVAKVNGEEISPQDFQQAYQSQYQQLQQMFGASFRPEMINEKQLREQVLQRLINQQLLSQQITHYHYAVSDAALVSSIQQMPVFQAGGKFSAQVYQSALADAGLTPAVFEQQQRQALAVEQLQEAIEDGAFATQAQTDAALALRNEQRQVAWIVVSQKKFMDRARISDVEIERYYKEHAARFMTPGKVTLAYVELDEARLATNVPASDAQLQAMYQQQLASFRQQEARHAAHILIAVNGDSPKADAAAKVKAEEILKQLRAGANFAKLAQKYSDDPGSARNGGDLGWVTRGTMVKPFEEALFAIPKVGDLAGPIRSQYGYHIIKLLGIRAPSIKSFAEVRAQLLAEYQKKQADDEYYALGQKLADLAYSHPDSLQPVSKELNLPIQTVADVTRDTGTGIAAFAAVRKAAFSDSVLNQGNNSDPIQIGPNHVVVIRVQKHVPSEPKPLAAVRAEIIAALKEKQAAARAATVAGEIAAAWRGGADGAALAKRYGFVYRPAALLKRDDTAAPAALVSAAFAAPHPAGQPVIGVAALPQGDQAVFALQGVQPGNPSALPPEQRSKEAGQLARLNGEAEFAAYLADLRAHAKIKINRGNLQAE